MNCFLLESWFFRFWFCMGQWKVLLLPLSNLLLVLPNECLFVIFQNCPYDKPKWKHISVFQMGVKKFNNGTWFHCTSIQWNYNFVVNFFHPYLQNGNIFPLYNDSYTTKCVSIVLLFCHSNFCNRNTFHVVYLQNKNMICCVSNSTHNKIMILLCFKKKNT